MHKAFKIYQHTQVAFKKISSRTTILNKAFRQIQKIK